MRTTTTPVDMLGSPGTMTIGRCLEHVEPRNGSAQANSDVEPAYSSRALSTSIVIAAGVLYSWVGALFA